MMQKYTLKNTMYFSIVLFITISFFINDAYAQYTYVTNTSDLPEVLLQLVIRDSGGRLVSYVEANQIVAIDPMVLDKYLDDMPDKKTILRDGVSYELIQWKAKTEVIDKRHAMTLFVLYAPVNDSYWSALEVLHNSYQVEPNDTVEVYWTVIRPVS